MPDLWGQYLQGITQPNPFLPTARPDVPNPFQMGGQRNRLATQALPSLFSQPAMQQGRIQPGGASFQTQAQQRTPQAYAGGTQGGFGQQQGFGYQQGGYQAQTPSQGQMGGGLAFDLPGGGVYGAQKWSGGNGIDVFTRGPITARQGGQVVGVGPGYVQVRFDSGLYATFAHTRAMVQGRFGPGQQFAYIDDASMNTLNPGPIRAIGGRDYQHADVRLSMRGPVDGTFAGISGGEINAAQYLRNGGYQGRFTGGRTPGPQEGGGGGMGNPFGGGGFGMPGAGGFGMGPQQGPMGFGGGFGGGGSPFGGGMPQMNPFMMGGGMGPMNPFMMGGGGPPMNPFMMQGAMGFGGGFGRF